MKKSKFSNDRDFSLEGGGGWQKKNTNPSFDPFPKLMNPVHFPNYSCRIPFYIPTHSKLKNFIFLKF